MVLFPSSSFGWCCFLLRRLGGFFPSPPSSLLPPLIPRNAAQLRLHQRWARTRAGERNGCWDNGEEAVGTAGPLEPSKRDQDLRSQSEHHAGPGHLGGGIRDLRGDHEEGDMLYVVTRQWRSLTRPRRTRTVCMMKMEVTCEGVHNLMVELEWGLSGGQQMQRAARGGLR